VLAKGPSTLPKFDKIHHKNIKNAAEWASVKSSTNFWSTGLEITNNGRDAGENKKKQTMCHCRDRRSPASSGLQW